MRALVTGGTGFVGANLVAALNEKAISARVLARESSSLLALDGLAYELVIGDILDPVESLTSPMIDCDWVFHVAAVSDHWRQSKERIYKINVQGTRNVLDAARIAKVKRFVFTSSLAAMGLPTNGSPLDESDVFDLEPDEYPYGHSKHLAEIEIQKAVDSGLAATIVNLPVVIGPRDVNLIAGGLLIDVANGRMPFYPPGGVNFVSAQDVAEGHIAAALRGVAGERYILAGHNMTYREAAEKVCQVADCNPPRFRIPEWGIPMMAGGVDLFRKVLGNRIPYDGVQVRLSGRRVFADGQKAIRELGLPVSPFKEAVNQAYDWYNRYGYLG
jgi:dihydroflavonol-4-reductase